MSGWKCEICHKTFKYEYLLKRHNERKKPCKEKYITETTDSRFKLIDNRLDETKEELNNTKIALEKLSEKIESQNELEKQINDFVSSDKVEDIKANSVSKDEAKSRVNSFFA